MKLTQRPMPNYGLIIDWETSGSNWGGDSTKDFQGLAFGAIVFNLSTFEPVDKLYVELKFDAERYKWQDAAERVHGLTREHLEANGVTREEAAVLFGEFFLKYFAPDETVFFLGHHANFDIAFTEQLLGEFGLMFKVNPSILDTSSAGYIMFGIHKSQDLFNFLQLNEERKVHNALEDCELTLQAAAMMRKIVNSVFS